MTHENYIETKYKEQIDIAYFNINEIVMSSLENGV